MSRRDDEPEQYKTEDRHTTEVPSGKAEARAQKHPTCQLQEGGPPGVHVSMPRRISPEQHATCNPYEHADSERESTKCFGGQVEKEASASRGGNRNAISKGNMYRKNLPPHAHRNATEQPRVAGNLSRPPTWT